MDVKKEKILFTLPNLNGGGAERVIVNIIKSLDENKYDIKLLLVDKIGVYIELVPEYVEIISLDVKRTRNALLKIIKTINEIKPNIIFSTINRMNILVLMSSYFIKRDIKIYVREPNLPSAQIKNKSLTFLDKVLIRILYPRAYKIVAQTDEMNEEVYKYFGIKKTNIVTLINPIDKENIDKNLVNIKNPFEEGYINLVAVGRLNYQKGFDLLIESMSHVVKKSDNYRLYILGEGEDREKLEEMIKTYGIEQNVFLSGFQKNPHRYLKYANAFVLSSRWEGLPNVVLESLYIETPVITTKVVKILDDLIIDGVNGYFISSDSIDIRNKILKLDRLKLEFKQDFIENNIDKLFFTREKSSINE